MPSLRSGSSFSTALVSSAAALRRAFDSLAAALMIGGARRLGLPFRAPPVPPRRFRAPRDRRVAFEHGGSSSGADLMLAGGSAEGEQPFLNPLKFLRIEIHLALERFERLDGAVERHQRRVERLDHRSEQPDPLALARQPPHQRGQHRAGRRRARSAPRRRRARRRPTFSSCIRCWRRSASSVSSPASGASSSSSATTWRAYSSSRWRALDHGPAGGRPPLRPRCSAGMAVGGRVDVRRHGRHRRRARRDGVAASTRARSACWPWISTASEPISRIRPAETGLSLMKARVRPSAYCTRLQDHFLVVGDLVGAQAASRTG